MWPTHMFGLRVFAYLLSLPLMSGSQPWREISLSGGKSQIYLQLEFGLTVVGLLFVSLRTGTFVSICPFLMSTCHRNGGHRQGLLQESSVAFSLGLPFLPLNYEIVIVICGPLPGNCSGEGGQELSAFILLEH